MGDHRVSLLGNSWRRNEDPERSSDPQVRAVLGALATLPAPEMRVEFREDLRAQLVAIAPRIVAESASTQAKPAARRPSPTPQGRRSGAKAKHSDRVLHVNLGRPLAVMAAMVVAFAVILGGAVLMSKNALPGDALYGLKRASERFQLATDGSDTEKAADYLDFAKTRVQEVGDLVAESAGADLIKSTLASSDKDVLSASRLLGQSAVKHDSAAPLTTLTNWTPGQIARLRTVAAAIHDPASRAQAVTSMQVVQAAAQRASALKSYLACKCLSTKTKDVLGPLPCVNCAPAQGGSTGIPGVSGVPVPNGGGVVPGGGAKQGSTTGAGQSGLPGVPGIPVGSAGPGGLPVQVPSLGGSGGPLGTVTSPLPKPPPIIKSLAPSKLLPSKLPIINTTLTPTAPLNVLPTTCVSIPVIGGGLGLGCSGH